MKTEKYRNIVFSKQIDNNDENTYQLALKKKILKNRNNIKKFKELEIEDAEDEDKDAKNHIFKKLKSSVDILREKQYAGVKSELKATNDVIIYVIDDIYTSTEVNNINNNSVIIDDQLGFYRANDGIKTITKKNIHITIDEGTEIEIEKDIKKNDINFIEPIKYELQSEEGQAPERITVADEKMEIEISNFKFDIYIQFKINTNPNYYLITINNQNNNEVDLILQTLNVDDGTTYTGKIETKKNKTEITIKDNLNNLSDLYLHTKDIFDKLRQKLNNDKKEIDTPYPIIKGELNDKYIDKSITLKTNQDAIYQTVRNISGLSSNPNSNYRITRDKNNIKIETKDNPHDLQKFYLNKLIHKLRGHQQTNDKYFKFEIPLFRFRFWKSNKEVRFQYDFNTKRLSCYFSISTYDKIQDSINVREITINKDRIYFKLNNNNNDNDSIIEQLKKCNEFFNITTLKGSVSMYIGQIFKAGGTLKNIQHIWDHFENIKLDKYEVKYKKVTGKYIIFTNHELIKEYIKNQDDSCTPVQEHRSSLHYSLCIQKIIENDECERITFTEVESRGRDEDKGKKDPSSKKKSRSRGSSISSRGSSISSRGSSISSERSKGSGKSNKKKHRNEARRGRGSERGGRGSERGGRGSERGGRGRGRGRGRGGRGRGGRGRGRGGRGKSEGYVEPINIKIYNYTVKKKLI